MTIVDAHLHLWDLARGDYGWITPELGELHATFGPDRAEPELRAAGVDRAVLVQASDTASDTEYMLAVADAHPWVGGVVGWLDLTDPSAAAAMLERWTAHPRFRGVRTLLHTDPREGMLARDDVRRTLRAISDAGLAFDVPDAWPRLLPDLADLARAIPELTIVVDHLAKPPRGDDLEPWRRELTRAAAGGGTVAKLSGLHQPGAAYSTTALRPIWDTALELFGPSRLLWGSDWPITVPAGGYGPTFAVLRDLIATLSPAEQELILGGTATRVYRISD